MPESFNAQRLEELSYLWTSGEWTVHRYYYSCGRVIFVFLEGRPTLRELLSVRALVPHFKDAPMSLLKSTVGDLPEFVVGEFPSMKARRLQDEAQARGLRVRMEDASFVSYMPVKHDGALIIEDEELATLAGEEMIRRGVPVVESERD